MNSFIFDGNKPRAPMSAEDQKRAMVSAALNQPQDVGSGIAALGQALMYRRNKNGSFPVAPGGNALTGLFGLGAGKGGLY